MARIVALLDANVLYPAELRSFLLYLSVGGLYEAKWTHEIHEEWISNLLTNRSDLTRSKLERTHELMQQAAPNAMVTGYRRIIPTLTLPDPRDRHVLAAAIHCKANVIVTRNLRDFPPEVLEPFEVEAQSPDSFLLRLLAPSAEDVIKAAETHRLSLKNPPRTVPEYLSSLESQGLIRTVAEISAYLL